MTTTSRIAHLRENIARSALTATGAPTTTRIHDVQRVGTVFIVTTDNPTSRWARYTVEAFRIPTPDDTDRDYEPGNAPKIWCSLAGWNSNDADELPGLRAKAVDYASRA